MNAATDKITEIEDGIVGDEIDDVQATFPTSKNASLDEGLEVARNVGLVGLGDGHEFSDIFLTIMEGGDESESHGFAQDAEAGRNKVQGIAGERMRAGGDRRGWGIHFDLHYFYMTI